MIMVMMLKSMHWTREQRQNFAKNIEKREMIQKSEEEEIHVPRVREIKTDQISQRNPTKNQDPVVLSRAAPAKTPAQPHHSLLQLDAHPAPHANGD